MMDNVCWETVKSILEVVQQEQCKPVHVLLFGDFKQLPPATSRAPFIVDPLLLHDYKFRVLRQNRRPSHVFVFCVFAPPLERQTKNGVWSKTRRGAERSRTSMKC